MPSKEPQTLTLEEFAQLSDAPEGRGGQQKKINWDLVLEAIQEQPMSNASVFKMICEDKETYLFNPDADDPNQGTIWTKLKQWTTQGIIAKKVDKQGNIFYGPISKKRGRPAKG